MRRVLAGMVLAAATACSGGLRPIPGTTTRVEPAVPNPDAELELRIFTSRADCLGAGVSPDDLDACLPHVDRAHGEVRLAYQFRLDGEEYPMPALREHIEVSHQGTLVQDGRFGQAYEIVPHDPYPARQLYVLLIDGSASMGEHGRMRRVKQALLLREVQDAFFPQGVRTGVLLYQFTDGRPVPVGGDDIIENRAEYVRRVRQLRVMGGYTHLYDAVEWAATDLLRREDIEKKLLIEDMGVAIVALTDGFNNVSASDTCRDNAKRLTRLLRTIRRARQEARSFNQRPTIYTVGLGRPLRSRYRLPDEVPDRVSGLELCGRRYRTRRIDGDLETLGIDNVSLAWIAREGGGLSYVRRDRDGLGEAFRAAAAKRYGWFEVRYRVDPLYLRRTFRTRLRLLSFATAEASIRIHPSAWIDAPPGRLGPDGWTRPTGFLPTFALVLPVLGVLVALSHVGAVWVNATRALSGRTWRTPRRGGGR